MTPSSCRGEGSESTQTERNSFVANPEFLF
jgi:hypothetical protein